MERAAKTKAGQVAEPGKDENMTVENTTAGRPVPAQETYAEVRKGNDMDRHESPAKANGRETMKENKECPRWELPLDARMAWIENLVERIVATEPIRTAFADDQAFEVEVTCRQDAPDGELHSSDREWDPTGSCTYWVMALNQDEARERALDRFAREVPIKVVDHYDIVAEIVEGEIDDEDPDDGGDDESP